MVMADQGAVAVLTSLAAITGTVVLVQPGKVIMVRLVVSVIILTAVEAEVLALQVQVVVPVVLVAWGVLVRPSEDRHIQ